MDFTSVISLSASRATAAAPAGRPEAVAGA